MSFSRTPLTVDRATELAARALSDAMHAAGIPDGTLADFLGCGKTLVALLRRGERPLTAGRILQLPPALRADGAVMSPAASVLVVVVMLACLAATLDARRLLRAAEDAVRAEAHTQPKRRRRPLYAPASAIDLTAREVERSTIGPVVRCCARKPWSPVMAHTERGVAPACWLVRRGSC